jgi:hypothetical protein
MDRNELKVQALLEKISTLTTQYENQVADLRVELTMTSAELEAARERINELETPSDPENSEADSDPTDSTD